MLSSLPTTHVMIHKPTRAAALCASHEIEQGADAPNDSTSDMPPDAADPSSCRGVPMRRTPREAAPTQSPRAEAVVAASSRYPWCVATIGDPSNAGPRSRLPVRAPRDHRLTERLACRCDTLPHRSPRSSQHGHANRQPTAIRRAPRRTPEPSQYTVSACCNARGAAAARAPCSVRARLRRGWSVPRARCPT